MEFHNNTCLAELGSGGGGVLYSYISITTIEASKFYYNSATREGGTLHFSRSTVMSGGCNFVKNYSPIGAAIYAQDSSKIQLHDYLIIDSNTADRYAVIYLSNSEFRGYDSETIS